MKGGKQQMTKRIELPNQKNQNAQRKRNLQILGNIRSGHHQTSGDERKNWKIPQEDEKSTRNQTTSQKSHQRDKYQSCLLRKTFEPILKVDERTSTNGPDKKTHDDTSQNWHRLYVKKRRRKRTYQHWRYRRFIDTKTRRLHKKRGGRLITMTRNNTDNTSINRIKNTENKNRKKNNCMHISSNIYIFSVPSNF